MIAELDAHALGPAAVCDAVADARATALLLLVGHPEPAVSLVRAVRRDARLAGVLVGAPAGQPEFAEWAALLGRDGAAIPFLRYLPQRLAPLGAQVNVALRARLAGPPSFVAFEGYDTVVVLAEMLRARAAGSGRAAGPWSHVAVAGTRGQIRFSRVPGVSVWQWAAAPIQVADRDPAVPDRFRVRDTAEPGDAV